MTGLNLTPPLHSLTSSRVLHPLEYHWYAVVLRSPIAPKSKIYTLTPYIPMKALIGSTSSVCSKTIRRSSPVLIISIILPGSQWIIAIGVKKDYSPSRRFYGRRRVWTWLLRKNVFCGDDCEWVLGLRYMKLTWMVMGGRVVKPYIFHNWNRSRSHLLMV